MIAIKLADGSLYPVLESGEDGAKTITLSPARPGSHKISIQIYEDGNPTAALSELQLDGSGGDLALEFEQFGGEVQAVLRDLDSGAEVRESFSAEGTAELPDFDDFEAGGVELSEESGETLFDFEDAAEEPSEFEQEQLALTENIFDTDPSEDDEVYFDNEPEFSETDDEPGEVDEPARFEDAPRQQRPNAWMVGGIVFLVLAACFAAAYGIFSVFRGPEVPLIHEVSVLAAWLGAV